MPILVIVIVIVLVLVLVLIAIPVLQAISEGMRLSDRPIYVCYDGIEASGDSCGLYVSRRPQETQGISVHVHRVVVVVVVVVVCAIRVCRRWSVSQVSPFLVRPWVFL